MFWRGLGNEKSFGFLTFCKKRFRFQGFFVVSDIIMQFLNNKKDSLLKVLNDQL